MHAANSITPDDPDAGAAEARRDAILHVGAMLLAMHARARDAGRSRDYLQALVDAAAAVTESAAAIGPDGRAAARRRELGGRRAKESNGSHGSNGRVVT